MLKACLKYIGLESDLMYKESFQTLLKKIENSYYTKNPDAIVKHLSFSTTIYCRLLPYISLMEQRKLQ